MSKDRKLFIIAVVTSAAIIGYLIYYYERALHEQKVALRVERTEKFGVKRKEYTEVDIRAMIKKLATYQGDSIIINAKGELVSLDGQIQSVLQQMYMVEANIEPIEQEAETYDLPVPYLVYRTGINYYIAQYGDKNLKKADSKKSADSTIVK